MIQFYTGPMRPNLEYIIIVVFYIYQDGHFQTEEYPGKQARMMRKLKTVMKTERL